jgi:hypothetical protein
MSKYGCTVRVDVTSGAGDIALYESTVRDRARILCMRGVL